MPLHWRVSRKADHFVKACQYGGQKSSAPASGKWLFRCACRCHAFSSIRQIARHVWAINFSVRCSSSGFRDPPTETAERRADRVIKKRSDLNKQMQAMPHGQVVKRLVRPLTCRKPAKICALFHCLPLQKGFCSSESAKRMFEASPAPKITNSLISSKLMMQFGERIPV